MHYDFENSKTNAGRAPTFEELLADELPPTAQPAPIAGPSLSSSSSKSRKTKGKEQVNMSSEMEEEIRKQLEMRKSKQATTPATSIPSDYEMSHMPVPTEATKSGKGWYHLIKSSLHSLASHGCSRLPRTAVKKT